MYNKFLLLGALLIGCAFSQDENELLDKFKDNIPEGFNTSSLPQKEEVEKVLREKCDKNGGAGAFDEIVNSKDYIQTCFEKHINTTVLMEELNEAKKDGSMDEVFGKYCKNRSQMLECVTTVTKKIEKCLEPSEKDNMKIVMNVTESLAEFVCFKDGDRLAMFVAEGGFECLNDHKEGLQNCANKTLANRIPSDLSLTSLPMLAFGESECADMVKLQECAVEELENCKDNTPANLVEALFKFIKRVTPCGKDNPMAPLAQNYERNIQILEKVKRSQPVEFSFIKSFESKCKKYAGPTAYRDLEQSVNNLKLCVQEQLKSENACARLPTEVRNCSSTVINKLRICLPPQESYLPNFAHGSIDAVLNYICDNNGKNFKRLTYSNGLTCLLSNDPKTLNDCLSGTKTKRTKDNDIVTKAELCEDLGKVQLCLSTYITNHCREMSDFKEVTIGIMDAFKAPCSSCKSYVNQFILFITVFLTIYS